MFTNLVFAPKRHVLLCSKPLDLPTYKFRLTPMLLSYPKSYVSKRTLSSARLISKRFSLVSLLFASWIFVPTERKKELALMLLLPRASRRLSNVLCSEQKRKALLGSEEFSTAHVCNECPEIAAIFRQELVFLSQT